MKRVCFLLLLLIIPTLGACAAPAYPRYQPIVQGELGDGPQQGYSSYQIDERTYLVTYQGFNPVSAGLWKRLSHEEWIEMAQDYVLYRSAELAKSRGAKQFMILHRDDANQSWRVWKSARDHRGRSTAIEVHMGFIPSARVLIRLLPNDGVLNLRSENHVHKVDRLLAVLMKGNARLAAQLETVAPQGDIQASKSRFHRWRASALFEDTGLERSLTNRKSSLLDTDITEESHGVFKIALWSRLPLSAIDLLRECLKIADREGYPAFKLEDWTTEEYRPGRYWNDWNDKNAWFQSKARLVLQHQGEPNSLDPVFVVDEIRENVTR